MIDTNVQLLIRHLIDRAKKAIKSRRLRGLKLNVLYCSSFIFKENHVFNGKDNLLEKVVIVEEKKDDIDIDDIVNLEDLPELAVIDGECGNPEIVGSC